MSCGATFSVVPFVNQRALGSVAGIVGAGGNAGAVAAGFLFKSSTEWWPTALLILGVAVTISSFVVLLIRSPSAEESTELAGTLAGDVHPGQGVPKVASIPGIEPVGA
jgi:MFS transporter, NNP family, nitrate/nitrite transporter